MSLPSRLKAPLWHMVKSLVRKPESQLIRFSNTNFKILPSDQKIEEEAHDLISNGKYRYYPIQVGHIVKEKYQILGKLGYGLGSTVWLANELKPYSRRYPVVLKVFTNDLQNREEINIYTHLRSVQSQHPGRNCIRNALDTFTIQGPNGEHQCLVHEPMLENTQELLRRNPSHRFTEDLLKIYLQHLLLALDYLHTEAHLIHTGKSQLQTQCHQQNLTDSQTSVPGTFF